MDAIIIDDEPLARESLKGLLEIFCPTVQVVSFATSVNEGLQILNNVTPEVLFLDITLGNRSGFELLDALKQSDIAVIFITASDKDSLKAFDYAAVDYLLKPISGSRLQKAVEKVHNKIKPITKQVKGVNKIADNEKKSKTLYITTRRGAEIINTDNIAYIQAMSNYSQLTLLDGEKITTSKVLRSFEEELFLYKQFLRVHKSFIVNLQQIRSIDRSNKSQEIKLTTGAALPCNNFDLLKERIESL